ncbi:GNAT family N-acetyltransferase [Streptomyces sp. NE06-03E]|uniref:GNAT family N-acetyltransferase n=1 Tax=unclassified Streptomyces TaxID=2593676 RepID=UPI0029A48ABF|nr:GNAT family N-acetyltransferase [Streptomyces sp. NE06-03E]MDX3054285.1 GNAT family N-acetyltransferase [Streptomyces sp. NE06-03E]
MSNMKRAAVDERISFEEADREDGMRFDAALLALLTELRPGVDRQSLKELLTEGHAQGLRFLVAYVDGVAVATAGYRVLVTSRGRLLYVDDLVTAASARSQGIAGALMRELKRRAAVANCARIELDSGVTNTSAHRFYLAHRLDIKALHFSAPISVD